jgi:mxaJ protein
LVALIALLAWSVASASSQEGHWELRVCAPHHNPPASSSEAGGFDNDIAAILADELGAHLSFEWIVLTARCAGSLHLGSATSSSVSVRA